MSTGLSLMEIHFNFRGIIRVRELLVGRYEISTIGTISTGSEIGPAVQLGMEKREGVPAAH